jgi:hypothetical protein
MVSAVVRLVKIGPLPDQTSRKEPLGLGVDFW